MMYAVSSSPRDDYYRSDTLRSAPLGQLTDGRVIRAVAEVGRVSFSEITPLKVIISHG